MKNENKAQFCTAKGKKESSGFKIGNRWWLYGIIALFATCTVLSGCSESSTKVGSDTSSQSQTSTKVGSDVSSQSQTSQDEKKEYKVGDIIAFDNKEITVTNVDKNYKPKYSTAKSGEQFIKVSVRVENKSSSKISVNPYDFKVQDSQGSIENVASPTYSLDDMYQSAELASGGTRTGSVVFEVPKNDSGLKFIYEPSFWSNKKVEVKL